MAPPEVIKSVVSMVFEYDTPRIVHIRSKKVGAFNRLIQLLIIIYIVGYVIYYEKGYQEFDNVQSAVTTKLKGVVFTNFTDVPGLSGRIWDVTDYVIPPHENNAFFVMTNVIVTPKQIQGACPEDPGVKAALCNDSTQCTPGQPLMLGNGIMTGNCVESRQPGKKVCEIYAWCPVEDDMHAADYPGPALMGAQNFTVFIKNSIEFPRFKVQRRNIVGFKNDKELGKCRFDPNHPKNKFCPIFELSKMISEAGVEDYVSLASKGGVIQVIINWDCNLDFSEEYCLPEYSFRRLDRSDFKISRGFNFRFSDHFILENGSSERTLYKAYGIRFIVSVQGRAGKVGPIPLFLNIASGLALLSIATVIGDILLLYALKARAYYRNKKVLVVKGEDAYEKLYEAKSSKLEMDKDEGETRQRTCSSSRHTIEEPRH